MNNFQQLQQETYRARQQKEAERLKLEHARRERRRLRTAIRRLRQEIDPQQAPQTEQLEALERQLSLIEQTIQQAEQDYQSAIAIEQAAIEAMHLERIKENLEQLPDDAPFLLFPLRLETRFRKDVHPGAEKPHQLWVRIFPDTCLVDNFQPELTDAEIKSGQVFWKKFEDAEMLTGYEAKENAKKEAWAVLLKSHGEGRARYIIHQLGEKNSPPADNEAAPVFPWRQPQSTILPERFVFIGHTTAGTVIEQTGNYVATPLYLGPDADEPKPESGESAEELFLGENTEWMTDFGVAVEKGMGFRIDLTEIEYIRGFSRILVLGLRLGSDAEAGQQELQNLFLHQQHSSSGFSIVPQGTPTNNTDGTGAGYTRWEKPEHSYDSVFHPLTLTQLEQTSWLYKPDGLWLAEWLGIEVPYLSTVNGSKGSDQSDAKAMNRALWPATMGYFLKTGMNPLVSETVANETRWFFNHFVSGRGPVPAIRIGRQPYGIQPTTAFSRMKWRTTTVNPVQFPYIEGNTNEVSQAFLINFYSLLDKLDNDGGLAVSWKNFLRDAPHIGKNTGQAYQNLLDTIGLDAGSVEFYSRAGLHYDQLYNLGLLLDPGYTLIDFNEEKALQLLQHLGVNVDELPKEYFKFFTEKARKMEKPLVTSGIGQLAGHLPQNSEGKNYIDWLISRIPEESGENGQVLFQELQSMKDISPVPSDFLFPALRHTLLLSYFDTGISIISKHIVTFNSQNAHRQRHFIGISENAHLSESPLYYLYGYKIVQVTNGYEVQEITKESPLQPGEKTVIEFIGAEPESAKELDDYLWQIKEALNKLKNASTDRLERVLQEHLDCVSYRLDAWRTGLIGYRLAAMRYREEGVKKGIYLGAYSWLEHVYPKEPPEQIKMNPELAQVFPKEAPLFRDPGNGGYIHAPSLNQAVTAAVLRNAYQSGHERLAVNLSSERMRRALYLLDGIRQGQTLNALLGYQLERGLHDGANKYGVELDEFIAPLRRLFPLVANRIATSRTTTNAETIAARNVVDGLKLKKFVENEGWGSLWEKLNTELSEEEALKKEIDLLQESFDALADLGMAESVHQATQGNYARAAAALDPMGTPPEPEVLRTHRKGKVLNHCVALHFDPDAVADDKDTPRAKAAPEINQWLKQILPDTAHIACVVRLDGRNQAFWKVTLADLGLQPIDLLFVGEQLISEWAVHFVRHGAHDGIAPDPTDLLTVDFKSPPDEYSTTFFELEPMLVSLRSLILNARPLMPADLQLAAQAQNRGNEAQWKFEQADKDKFDSANGISALGDDIKYFIDQLKGAGAWDWDKKYAELLKKAGLYGIGQANLGFIEEWRRAALADKPHFGKFREIINTHAEALLSEVQERVTGAKALFGDKFPFVQRFNTKSAGRHWRSAAQHKDELFDFLSEKGVDFPLDEWLYGIARVRDQMRHWENVSMLAEALKGDGAVPELTPLQLPYSPQSENDEDPKKDYWLALEFPDWYNLDSERLLYTAHFADGATPANTKQCGLLIDHWTEVIPVKEETTGLSFHFDRPNAEAPQSMLLVAPPDFKGHWAWEDLAGALNETLDMAKKRAVTPAQLGDTVLSRFLPATVFETDALNPVLF